MDETRPCTKCNGIARSQHDERRACPYCSGTGSFRKPDLASLASALKGRKGFLTSRPAGSREYYVWRMVRLYAGVDAKLPATAPVRIVGDPYRQELDRLAQCLVATVFGSAIPDASLEDELRIAVAAWQRAGPRRRGGLSRPRR